MKLFYLTWGSSSSAARKSQSWCHLNWEQIIQIKLKPVYSNLIIELRLEKVRMPPKLPQFGPSLQSWHNLLKAEQDFRISQNGRYGTYSLCKLVQIGHYLARIVNLCSKCVHTSWVSNPIYICAIYVDLPGFHLSDQKRLFVWAEDTKNYTACTLHRAPWWHITMWMNISVHCGVVWGRVL